MEIFLNQNLSSEGFGKPDPVHILNRGDAEQPQEEVNPAVLSALGDISLDKDVPESERRVVLANGSLDKKILLQLVLQLIGYGRGILGLELLRHQMILVELVGLHLTPSYLTVVLRFIRSGWSLKHCIG